jgi:hypothetical protein
MTTENPWVRYHEIAERIDAAMMLDGVQCSPADAMMACLILIGQILTAAPEVAFAQEVTNAAPHLETLLEAVERARAGNKLQWFDWCAGAARTSRSRRALGTRDQ